MYTSKSIPPTVLEGFLAKDQTGWSHLSHPKGHGPVHWYLHWWQGHSYFICYPITCIVTGRDVGNKVVLSPQKDSVQVKNNMSYQTMVINSVTIGYVSYQTTVINSVTIGYVSYQTTVINSVTIGYVSYQTTVINSVTIGYVSYQTTVINSVTIGYVSYQTTVINSVTIGWLQGYQTLPPPLSLCLLAKAVPLCSSSSSGSCCSS